MAAILYDSTVVAVAVAVAVVSTSNTASHDNHEKINSWVSFSFLYGYGAPLGGPSGCRSSAITWSEFPVKLVRKLLVFPSEKSVHF